MIIISWKPGLCFFFPKNHNKAYRATTFMIILSWHWYLSQNFFPRKFLCFQILQIFTGDAGWDSLCSTDLLHVSPFHDFYIKPTTHLLFFRQSWDMLSLKLQFLVTAVTVCTCKLYFAFTITSRQHTACTQSSSFLWNFIPCYYVQPCIYVCAFHCTTA